MSGVALAPHEFPKNTKTRVMQILWPFATFALYAFVSFYVLPIGWYFGMAKLGLQLGQDNLAVTVYSLLFYWFFAWGVTAVSASIIDSMAEHLFPEVPYYNASKRPVIGTASRMQYHWEHLLHTMLITVLQFFFQVDEVWNWLFRVVRMRYSGDASPVFQHAAGNVTAVTGDPMLDIMMGHQSEDMWIQYIRPGSGSVLGDLLLTFALVQTCMILSDVMYWAWHLQQHKFKSIYRKTGHQYHHQFKYPIGAAGPWLNWVDVVMSGIPSHLWPMGLTLAIFQNLGFFNSGLFPVFGWKFMLQFYIHEMNHFDHCGKQVPVYSGCPLFPPLGWAMGWHESIPCHESHHNFGNVGFGLLGVADKLFGTIQYPVDHPKHIKGFRTGAKKAE